VKYSEVIEKIGIPKNLPESDVYAYLTHSLQDRGNKQWAENAAEYFSHDELQMLLPIDWDVPFPPVENPKFTFIDLFAGIGGFRLALQEQQGKCVFSSEWDRSAKRTYFKNFGEVPFGDIRAFTGEHIDDELLDTLIPDHNILTAGFPCQPFSRAGVSARTSLGKDHGFACKTQGTLFFDVVRIAKVKQPDVLLLENVRNLKSHDGGRTFITIKETIEQELGYSFFETVINAKTVVPQKRARCFMVCFKNNSLRFDFPVFDGDELSLRSALEKNVPAKYTISDKLWLGHQNRTERNLNRGAGFTAFEADLDKPANTLVARYGKDGKECLIPQNGKNPRKLTPRECARLQGYPEKYDLPDSDAAAYRQFGNSVPVPVVQRIADRIVKVLEY
jgi:DNA (cytosine-5)-methyltransferase 1